MDERLATLVGSDLLSGICTDAWVSSRVKLAQYLRSNDFASLAGYYQDLAWLQHRFTTASYKTPLLLFAALGNLNPRHEEVEKIIRSDVRSVEGDKTHELWVKAIVDSKKQGRATDLQRDL